MAAEQGLSQDSKALSKSQRKRGDTSSARDQVTGDVTEISPSSSLSKGKGKARIKKRQPLNKGLEAQGSAAINNHNPDVEDNSDDVDDDGLDNKEFAKQLSNLKAGTSLTKSPSNGEPGKNKKIGKRIEAPAIIADVHSDTNDARNAKGISNASSTTGGDGDDDLSSTHSPELKATSGTKASGDVSDMLEAKAKGPSVLRLTEPSEPQIVRPAKAQKPVQEQETKKQRQHRKKNEERKLAREEAEKERRVVLEKQLRTAREAEGRPAKNGLSSSKPPATNAWAQPITNAAASSSSRADVNTMLLDTFDEKSGSATGVHEHGGDSVAAPNKIWDRDLPPEEEQMRLLSEMDGNDGWSTVKKNTKSKRKTNVGNDVNGANVVDNGKSTMVSSLNETSHNGVYDVSASTNSTTSDSSLDAAQVRNKSSGAHKTVHEKADPNIWNRDNIHDHPHYDPRYPWALIGHPDDSDWAVI